MYFKSAFLAVVLCVSSLTSVQGLAGVSGKLMQVASSHSGHFTLERHNFITELREGDFRREQVAQFFCDRIFILEIMESILDFGPSAGEESWNQLPSAQKIFFRSLPYREELLKLVGNSSYFQPTVPAIDYGNYLKSARHEVVALHFWLFLIGETFGAQHISDYIAKKYPQVGEASKNFEDMKLMTVRGIFNKWIDNQFPTGTEANYPEIDFKDEIGVAYAYMTHLFDASDTAPRVSSYQSAVLAFSRLFN